MSKKESIIGYSIAIIFLLIGVGLVFYSQEYQVKEKQDHVDMYMEKWDFAMRYNDTDKRQDFFKEMRFYGETLEDYEEFIDARMVYLITSIIFAVGLVMALFCVLMILYYSDKHFTDYKERKRLEYLEK